MENAAGLPGPRERRAGPGLPAPCGSSAACARPRSDARQGSECALLTRRHKALIKCVGRRDGLSSPSSAALSKRAAEGLPTWFGSWGPGGRRFCPWVRVGCWWQLHRGTPGVK